MNQKDKERKDQVAHMIDIPDEYRLVVDDQEGVDDPYHLVWWEHKEDEERTIQITLNRHTGNLIEFSIDDEIYFSSGKEAIDENKAREIANAFLKKYTKEGYEFYTYCKNTSCFRCMSPCMFYDNHLSAHRTLTLVPCISTCSFKFHICIIPPCSTSSLQERTRSSSLTSYL